MVVLAQGALGDVTAELAALPAVLEAYATTGSSDVLCRLGAVSHEDLQDTLLALGRSPLVARSTSVVVLSTLVAPRWRPLLERESSSTPARGRSCSAASRSTSRASSESTGAS